MTLHFEVIDDESDIALVVPDHARWVHLVEQGRTISIPVPDTEVDDRATRDKINGALRHRGVKARVLRGTNPDGQRVFLVRKR
jgi:hypothetical protein